VETPSAYASIVSPRSRRLRTVGIVLLVAVCAMVLYGYLGLMPSIERSVRADSPIAAQSEALRSPSAGLDKPPLTRAQRVHKLQVAVALAYWGVCALLLVGLVLVAWLDLREISRRYAAERRAMWSQAADRIGRSDDTA
jgi:hypothetical protein